MSLLCVYDHGLLADTDKTSKYFNQPGLRSHLIREHLDAKFSSIQWVPNVNTMHENVLSSLDVHSEKYIDFLEGAYSSALASGDADWFNDGILIPNHFLPSNLRLRSDVPLYKQAGYFTNDTMTPIKHDTCVTAMRAAQSTYLASEYLIDAKGKSLIYALTGSPGHHARRAGYAGYCFLNNAGIAARNITQKTGKRVGILDLDYHAGDGTQDIFNACSDVVTASIHANPAIDYPTFSGFEDEIGIDAGHGFNRNFCFGKGIRFPEYLQLVNKALAFIHETRCAYLIVAFGADTFQGDPDPSVIAGAALEIEDYRSIGKALRQSGIPLMVTQEGGYNLEAVPSIVANLFDGILS
jgi:acetoin utilization deacetylase AcuC-like enzyme